MTAPAKRRIGHGIVDFLGGLPLFTTAPLHRHWHMRWGATDNEVRARPENVWPWIVQMGYRRAGFCTYDIADNAGYPSADRILEEYQHFAVGDWAFNMNSMFGLELPINEFDAFKVRAFESHRWLVWAKPDSTWSWLLTPLGHGQTRLILRIRARPVLLKGIKARAERIEARRLDATQLEVKGTEHGSGHRAV